MHNSLLAFLLFTMSAAPAAAEVAVHAGGIASASPWIMLGALAIFRTFACFMERSAEFDLER